ncbi:MAG: FeoA family protein [bacterium]
MLRKSNIPLAFAEEGKAYEVVEIMGGRGALLKLMEMGIYPGAQLRVISQSRGPLIVGIGDSRIALGRGIAMKIMVK